MSPQKFFAKLRASNRKRTVFYVKCLSVSWFLQLLGFILPGWGYLKGDMISIHVGLWYRITCKKTGGCQTDSMVTGQTNKDDDMLEYQIETFLSLAACAVAITTLVFQMKNVKNKMIVLDIGMLASLLSGVLSLTASCKMGYNYQQRHNEQMVGYGRSVYKSPYSLFLTGTGGIIACLITFLLVLETHILFKNLLRKHSAVNNQSFSVEQQMVAMVNTGDNYSLRQSIGIPSQSSATYTNVPINRNEVIPTLQEVNSTNNDKHYMYAWPTTKHEHGSKDNKKSSTENVQIDDANVRPEYGNIMLANGQRFITNAIYNT